MYRVCAPCVLAVLLASCGGKKDSPQKPTPANSSAGSAQDIEASSLVGGRDFVVDKDFSGRKLFRFTLARKGDLSLTGHKISLQCSGQVALSLTVESLGGAQSLTGSTVANLLADSSITLEKGTYALVVAKSGSAPCSNLSFQFGTRLVLEQVTEPTVDPTPEPTRAPLDPEASRIWRNELKDATPIEFVSQTSKTEGCQVVMRRTMSEIKARSGLSRGGEEPLTLSISRDNVLEETRLSFQQNSSPLGTIFYFDVMDQADDTTDWSTVLREKLLVSGEGARISLDSACRGAGVPWASNIFMFNELPLWQKANEDRLPLRTAGGFPDVRFTYSTSAENPSLKIEAGIDTAELLKKLGSIPASEITRVQWMLGRTDSNRYDWPVSDWQNVDTAQFLSQRFTMELGEFSSRALWKFYRNVVAFRIFTSSDHGLSQEFFIPVKYFCDPAYTRADASAFHAALFHDLTHPEWDGSPDQEARRGCAFVGAE